MQFSTFILSFRSRDSSWLREWLSQYLWGYPKLSDYPLKCRPLKQAHKRNSGLKVPENQYQVGENRQDAEGELISSIPVHASSLNEKMVDIVSESSMLGRTNKEVRSPRDDKTQIDSVR